MHDSDKAEKMPDRYLMELKGNGPNSVPRQEILEWITDPEIIGHLSTLKAQEIDNPTHADLLPRRLRDDQKHDQEDIWKTKIGELANAARHLPQNQTALASRLEDENDPQERQWCRMAIVIRCIINARDVPSVDRSRKSGKDVELRERIVAELLYTAIDDLLVHPIDGFFAKRIAEYRQQILGDTQAGPSTHATATAADTGQVQPATQASTAVMLPDSSSSAAQGNRYKRGRESGHGSPSNASNKRRNSEAPTPDSKSDDHDPSTRDQNVDQQQELVSEADDPPHKPPMTLSDASSNEAAVLPSSSNLMSRRRHEGSSRTALLERIGDLQSELGNEIEAHRQTRRELQMARDEIEEMRSVGRRFYELFVKSRHDDGSQDIEA